MTGLTGFPGVVVMVTAVMITWSLLHNDVVDAKSLSSNPFDYQFNYDADVIRKLSDVIGVRKCRRIDDDI